MSDKQIKVAVVTQNGKTISQHFGMAKHYAVHTVENGQSVGQELRDKSHHKGHEHGGGQSNQVGLGDIQVGTPQPAPSPEPEPEHHGHGHDHQAMMDSIGDCNVVITRGIGYGAYSALQQAGLEVIITDIAEIDTAVRAYANGDIENHLEKLH